MQEVLTVRVRIKETYEVHGQRGLARMILFDGEGEGSGFYGKGSSKSETTFPFCKFTPVLCKLSLPCINLIYNIITN